jgi:ubiquitin-conjugating enzyme E2 S
MMSNNMENVAPQVLRSVLKQAQNLAQEKMEGISVILNDADMTDIQANVDGPPGTPYAGGTFRIKIVLSRDYPATPPKGFFLTKIFHPNVGPQGEICVNTLKKDWKPDLGIKHILLTIKCLLIVPNPESALNEEAGKLLLEQYDSYCERAKLYTDIHAKSTKSSDSSSRSNENRKRTDCTSDQQQGEKKGKMMSKDKKRTLKRL